MSEWDDEMVDFEEQVLHSGQEIDDDWSKGEEIENPIIREEGIRGEATTEIERKSRMAGGLRTSRKLKTLSSKRRKSKRPKSGWIKRRHWKRSMRRSIKIFVFSGQKIQTCTEKE